MASGGQTLRERLIARRAKVKETMNETETEPTPRKENVDRTWAAAMEEEESIESGTVPNEESSVEIEEEEKQSEKLLQTLKSRRRKTQKELKTLKAQDGEDINELMHTIKQKAKERVLHETSRSATEGEDETAGSAAEADDKVPRLKIPGDEEGGEEGRAAPVSDRSQGPPASARDVTSPRGDARRVSSAMGESIRARLTQKLRDAKDKGKDAAYDESRQQGRKFAGIRGTQRVTRFDDPSALRDDEEGLEAELERSLQARSKWKETVGKTVKAKDPVVTAEEAMDFFIRQWDEDAEDSDEDKDKDKDSDKDKDKDKDKGKDTDKEGDDQPEEGPSTSAAAAREGDVEAGPGEVDKADGPTDEESQKKTVEKKKKKSRKRKGLSEDEEPLLDDYDDVGEDSWKYYQMGKAIYKPFQKKIEDERDAYFFPSVREAETEQKLFGADQPRFLEEEGFYVGRRPDVASHNLHKMENRLLKEGAQAAPWFGEDGRLISLPDPLKEIPFRPPIVDEAIPDLLTDYQRAILCDTDRRYIGGAVAGTGRYQLDVDLNTMTFTHHHLFSREHVIAARLADIYGQYVSRSRKKAAESLSQKLKALKAAAHHVQDNISTMMKDKRVSEQTLLDQQNRLKEYKDEIKQCRKQRDDEMAADRQLAKHVIQTWRDIKAQRQLQQFTCTASKLVIRKEATNKAEDEEAWEADLQDELEERKHEAEDAYRTQMEAYKDQLQRWKAQRIQKKDANKRHKQRTRKRSRSRGREDEEGEEEAEDQAEKDQEILEQPDIPKPEKPKPLTDSESRQKVTERYDDIRRKPGEPILHFELTSGATITAMAVCPKVEQQRRQDVNRCRVFVKVLFNNKQVSQTPAKPLGQDFVVRFAQIFNVEIMQWPETIKLEIYETSGIGSTLLSVLYAAIPECNATTESVQLDELEFSSDIVKSHNHTGVGCGLSPNNSRAQEMEVIQMLSGSLTCSVAWAVDGSSALVPPSVGQTNHIYNGAMKGLDPVAAIGVSGMSDMDQLTKWIAESHLDPNDPSNADLMYLLRPVAGDALMSGLRMPEHFRIEQLQEEFNFVTDEDIDNNRRFRMILLREREVDSFRNKQIPALEKDIGDDIFAEYEKEQKQRDNLKSADATESHRIAVNQFMQKVREQVMLRFQVAAHQKVFSDMIFEDAVPNIGTILPSLMKLAEPRRPLRPTRRERKKVTAQNLQGMQVRVLVNVVRAFGIPIRAESADPSALSAGRSGAGGQDTLRSDTLRGDTLRGDTLRGTGGGTARAPGTIKNIAGETQVRPYVEVMFQRNTQSTSVADGPNPSWNEELALSFQPPNNDFSSSNLQTVKDSIYLNLFDEFIVDVVQDDRERGSSIHRRIEKRWLGSIKIPFTTVYFNSRIEGTFRLNKPPVLLGYCHESKAPRGGASDLGFDLGVGSGEHTYVTIFVTIEPPLTPAEPVREKFDSNEDDKLLQMADTWQADLEKKFPKREFKTTVVDINGKSVFLTRYFRALKPPEQLLASEDKKTQVDMVSRFVSMIPFVSDSVVFPGLCDIWSTCDQFLHMLQGDEEEHAVLLMNFFLSLGKKAWLLLGLAIPEGPTAYVITQEERDFWIWNASTGEHFSHRDNYCPVQSVGCVVNADNIWANVQPHEHPSRVSYDFSNHSHWKPFFHKGFPNPGVSSVQPSELMYLKTEKDYVLDLQDKIERALKEKIMEWRPRYITRWNRYCVQAFRRLLTKLEEGQRTGSAQQEHSQELEQILGSYKLCGFPINMPYTDMAPILDTVYSTGVHNYESSDVEFALAVHIHPYPNLVLSVWVYVASLVRKR